MTEKTMAPMIIYLLVLGCSPAERQQSSGEPLQQPASLPRITHKGTDYPYIRYAESTGQHASRGRAVFLHPIKARKTEILALEYAPGMKTHDLFGEELLGRSGEVINDAGVIKITSLPISIPVNPESTGSWQMRYGGREYFCKLVNKTTAERDIITSISCMSDKYSLRSVYNSRLGIVEFQDFCDDFICSYRLMDGQGVLSRAMLRSMNLLGS